jgi:hypothetical protein
MGLHDNTRCPRVMVNAQKQDISEKASQGSKFRTDLRKWYALKMFSCIGRGQVLLQLNIAMKCNVPLMVAILTFNEHIRNLVRCSV